MQRYCAKVLKGQIRKADEVPEMDPVEEEELAKATAELKSARFDLRDSYFRASAQKLF